MKQKELDEIKEQFKNGDNSYLEVLFEEYGAYCVQNIRKKFRCSSEDAQDLMIDAILNFRDKLLLGKITYITSIRNYLYTTCVYMRQEHLYYYKRKKEQQQGVIMYLYDDDDNLQEYKEELINKALDAFNQLGEACQQILQYFYVDKMSMVEIAAKMKLLNANTAKGKKARCYKRWREKAKRYT